MVSATALVIAFVAWLRSLEWVLMLMSSTCIVIVVSGFWCCRRFVAGWRYALSSNVAKLLPATIPLVGMICLDMVLLLVVSLLGPMYEFMETLSIGCG